VSAPARVLRGDAGDDLVTRGVDAQLDFSDTRPHAGVVEQCNQMPVLRPSSYVGKPGHTACLRYTTSCHCQGFGGIGGAGPAEGKTRRRTPVDVPYLNRPTRRRSLLRSVVGVQQPVGKGGIGYVLKSELRVFDLPRDLRRGIRPRSCRG